MAWVGLGAPVSSALTLAAHGLGLLITAGPRFGHDGAFERFIRIPIAYAPDDLDKGLDVLEQAWRQVTRQQGRLQPADTDSPELLTFV